MKGAPLGTALALLTNIKIGRKVCRVQKLKLIVNYVRKVVLYYWAKDLEIIALSSLLTLQATACPTWSLTKQPRVTTTMPMMTALTIPAVSQTLSTAM
jgi:hypothetical protein